MRYGEEAKKEAFRKYLESSGVMDSLTKVMSKWDVPVLVALYEHNDKLSSAVEFIQGKLGGLSLSEYEKSQAEMSDFRIKYNELLATNQETCKKLDDLNNSFRRIVPPRKPAIGMDRMARPPSEALTCEHLHLRRNKGSA